MTNTNSNFHNFVESETAKLEAAWAGARGTATELRLTAELLLRQADEADQEAARIRNAVLALKGQN